jgi:hypothetical protein
MRRDATVSVTLRMTLSGSISSRTSAPRMELCLAASGGPIAAANTAMSTSGRIRTLISAILPCSS